MVETVSDTPVELAAAGLDDSMYREEGEVRIHVSSLMKMCSPWKVEALVEGEAMRQRQSTVSQFQLLKSAPDARRSEKRRNSSRCVLNVPQGPKAQSKIVFLCCKSVSLTAAAKLTKYSRDPLANLHPHVTRSPKLLDT
jgi:hypothetical protein